MPHKSRQPKELTESQISELRDIKARLPSRYNLFLKAYQGLSKVACLKAKCIECSNLQPPEIGDCSISGCPLWRYRPYQNKRILPLTTPSDIKG